MCVCVFRARINVCVHMCSTHVCVPRVLCSRVHICVFTCTHVCVPIRHTVVFQENTCLLSDEHSCVCVCSGCAYICVCVNVYTYVCSRVHTSVFQLDTRLCSRRTRVCYQMNTRVFLCFPRAHKCVFTCAVHMCVFHVCCVHVYTYVCSRVHTSVFQLDTRLCSRRTRVCYQMNTRVRLCFPRAHKCVCVFTCAVHMCVLHVCTCVCSHVRICVSHVYTYVCSSVHTCVFQWARVCVPGEHMFVFR